MFDDGFIRKTLKKYIDAGINRYIIYPFGANGVNIKNCLENYFDIIPELLIDNEYAKYNKKINSFEVLRQSFDNNMYILLSIEDEKLNVEMQSALEVFVPRENVINLLKMKGGVNRVITNQFSLEYFLPDIKKNIYTKVQSNKNEKIKIRVLHTVYAFWNSISSICDAFKSDNRYDVLIILGDHDEDCDLRKKQMQEKDYTYVMWNDYDVKTDFPDVLLMTHLWERTTLYNFREYTKLIIVASVSLIKYGYSNSDFIDMVKIGFNKFQPDYYLFDSIVYNELKDTAFFKGKIVEMGNAKFDGIYESCKEKRYPLGWEKLKGKRTILWAPDHGINKGVTANTIRNEVTFDLYAKVIFQYAMENQEIGLIFRPHPAFIYEMTGLGYWSRGDLELLRNYCRDSVNIVFDETETYDAAYSVSDAVLSDALCGITCSALPTLKPICVLYRTGEEIRAFAEDLVKNYYSAHNEKELIDFLEMIKQNKDPMYNLRKIASEKYIKHFDGKNGLRIKKFIEVKYEELNKRASLDE